MTFTPAPVLGEVVVDQLIRLQVRDAVISPGSRNAPLTMALWRAQARGEIRLHTRIDERSAAFLALGIAKATGRPTPVICTSGSAAANLYPALLEAHHGGHGLIAVTADRPERLWQTGANQTTRQVDMFPSAIVQTLDLAVVGQGKGQVQNWRSAIAAAVTSNRPAHINVEFDEPLLGTLDWVEDIYVDVDLPALHNEPAQPLRKYHQRGVILVGHDSAGISFAEIAEFAEQSGWPILSENPLLDGALIGHPSLILADPDRRARLKPEIAMTVGRLTLSRAINSYLASADYQIVVDERIRDIDTHRTGDEIHFAMPKINQKIDVDPNWRRNFVETAAQVATKLAAHLEDWSEPAAVRTIVNELPAGAALFTSSSRPIRDIEAFATPRSGIESFANRGLAGIDGNLSSAFGIALCREQTYAIVGDLAFLHDINGLLIGSEEIRPNLTIIVIANDGGGIFSTLPQRDVPGFEKLFGTPHGRDLVKIAESYGIDAIAVRTLEALRAQLARGRDGIRVIVCQMPDRKSNAKLLSEITSSLALL